MFHLVYHDSWLLTKISIYEYIIVILKICKRWGNKIGMRQSGGSRVAFIVASARMILYDTCGKSARALA